MPVLREAASFPERIVVRRSVLEKRLVFNQVL